jgi:NAD(P)H-nitrite reductase large subunit
MGLGFSTLLPKRQGMVDGPDSSSESDSQTVCFCHTVSRGKIRQAIRDGARTLEEIQKRTRASTGCGGCELDVREILEELLNAQKP